MPPTNRRVATNQPRFVGKPRDGEEPPQEPAPPRTRIEYLDPNAIKWPQGRITSEYDEESTQRLMGSMAKGGQEEAVLVRQLENGSYEGVGGYNRCLAATRLNWTEIECAVRQGTHRDVIRANLRTALNKRDPNPMSTVRGIAHAYHQEELTIEEIVDDIEFSPEWVRDRLIVAETAEIVQQCLEEKRIAIGHAILLARIEDLSVQEEYLALQLKYGWTVKELDEQIRGKQEEVPVEDGPEDPAPKRPRERRAPEPTETTALACNVCSARQEDGADVEIIYLCKQCSGTIQGPGEEGRVSIPLGLLREAESILAGTQAGASVAERFAAFLEG